MTLISKLLGHSSPYIFNLVYDVDVRLLFIECLDDPSDKKPALRIVFPEINFYSEVNQAEAGDDELMDDLVSLEQVYNKKIVIHTTNGDLENKKLSNVSIILCNFVFRNSRLVNIFIFFF